MPYIPHSDRKRAEKTPFTPGELNYALTRVIQGYIGRKGPLNYTLINDIIGALSACSTEFSRRVVGPYEDKKRDENGEVWFDGL